MKKGMQFCFDFKFFKPKAFCIKISHLQLQCPTLLTVILYKQIFHNIHHRKSYGWNDKKKGKNKLSTISPNLFACYLILINRIISHYKRVEDATQFQLGVFLLFFFFGLVCLFAPVLFVYALRFIIIQVMFPNFLYI